ncbi:MAG: hypothetical protein K2W99_06295 [Chthoniobacterales bacterium]|nr:hypothetical protein [Chthoniobacterales bacterium]
MNFFFNKFKSGSKATTPISLGKRLAAAREASGLSIEGAAHKSGLSEECICSLESDFQKKKIINTSDSAYQRLILLRYIKFLSIPLTEISSQLPPMASLNPPGSFFLKNWGKEPSLPPAPCWRDPSSRFYFPPRLGLSLVRIGFLFFLILISFYACETLRHLYRTIAHF